jgi:nucleoside-diphosphate-sugar epimerase
MVLSDRQPVIFHRMAGAKKLVMGASGFLGSHVTRQLVERETGSALLMTPERPGSTIEVCRKNSH